jgi:glycosyltransferase involved in cell wall biosynthesis
VVAATLLAREQMERHAVGMVCHSSGSAAEQCREAGAQVWTMPVGRSIQPGRDLLHLHRLYRIVQQFQPDVLHAHSSKAGVLGRLAARMSGVPVVFSPQNFAYRAYEGTRAARFAFYVVERTLAPLTDCLHVVSRDEYEDAIGNKMSTSSRCGMVHNGIDLDPLLTMADHAEDNPLTVGTYARMFAQKRLDFLIDAFAILAARGVRFRGLVIGDGPERERLLVYAKERGIDADIVFDSAPHDAAAALSRIDVFALSSSHEACPLSVMEAMTAGRPVVATDVGAVSEVVTHGESGLIAPFGAVEEFADALERVITNTPLRRALGAAARRKAPSRFGSDVMAQRMDLLYRCAIEHSR